MNKVKYRTPSTWRRNQIYIIAKTRLRTVVNRFKKTAKIPTGHKPTNIGF